MKVTEQSVCEIDVRDSSVEVVDPPERDSEASVPTLRTFPSAPTFLGTTERILGDCDIHAASIGTDVTLFVFGRDKPGEGDGHMITLTMSPGTAILLSQRLRKAAVESAEKVGK